MMNCSKRMVNTLGSTGGRFSTTLRYLGGFNQTSIQSLGIGMIEVQYSDLLSLCMLYAPMLYYAV